MIMSDLILRKERISAFLKGPSWSFITVGCASLLLAELLYKFHSFTLELMAFLATCYCLNALVSALRRSSARRRRRAAPANTLASGLQSVRCHDV